MKKLFFITFIAAILIAKSICTFAFEAKDFFPLRKGTINKYILYEINAIDGTVTDKRTGFDTRTYLGKQIVNGKVVFAVKTEFAYEDRGKSKTTKIFCTDSPMSRLLPISYIGC